MKHLLSEQRADRGQQDKNREEVKEIHRIQKAVYTKCRTIIRLIEGIVNCPSDANGCTTPDGLFSNSLSAKLIDFRSQELVVRLRVTGSPILFAVLLVFLGGLHARPSRKPISNCNRWSWSKPGSWLVMLREILILIGIGVALGLPSIWAVKSIVAAQRFGISGPDPPAISGATFVPAAIAVVAGYVPARWASRVEPMRALHYDG